MSKDNQATYAIGETIKLSGGDSLDIQGTDGRFVYGTVSIDGKIGFGTFDLVNQKLVDTFLEGDQ
jgi:hypothetical protein